MARYTKAHFEEIAGLFRSSKPIWDDEEFTNGKIHQQAELIGKFCDLVQKSNPRFDKEKFLRACGL